MVIEKLGYEKLMEENGLALADLNKEAIVAIQTISDVKKSINMLSKKGKTISDKVIEKIKTNDKWACQEILEIIDGKERNTTAAAPHTKEEIITEIKQEIKQEIDETNSTDPNGLKIDGDLEKAFTEGKTTITAEELKTVSPTAYDIIAASYEEGKTNGVETSYYTLIEKEKHVFTLSKI